MGDDEGPASHLGFFTAFFDDPDEPLTKGLNLLNGLRLEILGIELGDTYADAKAKLEKLAAESAPPPKPQAAPKEVDPSNLAAMDGAVLGTSDSLNRLPPASGALHLGARDRYRMDETNVPRFCGNGLAR